MAIIQDQAGLPIEDQAGEPIQDQAGGDFVLALSDYIAASGEVTTNQLTTPSGKVGADFQAGRMQDDENPADAIDLASDKFTELEFCIKAASGATNGAEYEFRLTKAGVPIDTYSIFPKWTIPV